MGYNPIYLCVLFRLFQLWPLKVLFSAGSHVPLSVTCLYEFFFVWLLLALSYFLVLNNVPCSSYIFPALDLESAFSSWAFGSFIGERYKKLKMWVSDLLVVTEVIASRLCQLSESGNKSSVALTHA